MLGVCQVEIDCDVTIAEILFSSSWKSSEEALILINSGEETSPIDDWNSSQIKNLT